jgi:hypothetical protein
VYNDGSQSSREFVSALETVASERPTRRVTESHGLLASLMAAWFGERVRNVVAWLDQQRRVAQLGSVVKEDVRKAIEPAQQQYVADLDTVFHSTRLPRELRDARPLVASIKSLMLQGHSAMLITSDEQENVVRLLAEKSRIMDHWQVTQQTLENTMRRISSMRGDAERFVFLTLRGSFDTRSLALLVKSSQGTSVRLLLVYSPLVMQRLRLVPTCLASIAQSPGAAGGDGGGGVTEWKFKRGYGPAAVDDVVRRVSQLWADDAAFGSVADPLLLQNWVGSWRQEERPQSLDNWAGVDDWREDERSTR